MDLRIGHTRLVANPRGYPSQPECRTAYSASEVLFVLSEWTDEAARPSATWPSVPGLPPPTEEATAGMRAHPSGASTTAECAAAQRARTAARY